MTTKELKTKLDKLREATVRYVSLAAEGKAEKDAAKLLEALIEAKEADKIINEILDNFEK